MVTIKLSLRIEKIIKLKTNIANHVTFSQTFSYVKLVLTIFSFLRKTLVLVLTFSKKKSFSLCSLNLILQISKPCSFNFGTLFQIQGSPSLLWKLSLLPCTLHTPLNWRLCRYNQSPLCCSQGFFCQFS